jgi:hypothetical protein
MYLYVFTFRAKPDHVSASIYRLPYQYVSTNIYRLPYQYVSTNIYRLSYLYVSTNTYMHECIHSTKFCFATPFVLPPPSHIVFFPPALTRVVAHEAESLAGDLLLEVLFGEVRPAAEVRLDAEVSEFLPVTDAGPVYSLVCD